MILPSVWSISEGSSESQRPREIELEDMDMFWDGFKCNLDVFDQIATASFTDLSTISGKTFNLFLCYSSKIA
jgi:hypothetical protein